MAYELRRGLTWPYMRHIRLLPLCLSMCANALCAGGIYCFPIISPTLVAHLKLTQPQLTTIALVGMIGPYPFSAFIGKILDLYGAWACSLISACFLSAGFGLFARELTKMSDPATPLFVSTYPNLLLFFFISSVGTLFSYFSSVIAASKNFPNCVGIATGTSMAIFGLSPTFLSSLASRYFSSSEGEIDVTHFLQFLATLCGCVHLIGGFTMYIIPPVPKEPIIASDPEAPDERTVLLNKSNGNTYNDHQFHVDDSISDESKQTIVDILSDHNFWALAFIVFVVLGSCEMVISNVGTIVISLPNRITTGSTSDHNSSVSMTVTQVRMLSVANTLSRLVVGSLADIISPGPSCDSNRGVMRKYCISRIAFLTFSTVTLVFTYTWMVIGVKDQAGIWALSIGAGVAYGCAFTVLPFIISSIWGIANLGRNYGITSYATFLGTPAFSYLYAFISDAGAVLGGDSVCRGPACWTFTFEISALAAVLACGASMHLWRSWNGLL